MQPVRSHIMCALVASSFAAHLSAQQPAPPRLRLVEELRIDGATQDISGIGAVVAGPGGRVIFTEVQDFRLRFYDATGKEIARFGRRGEGPGEFGLSPGRRPAQADVVVGVLADTIWTYDQALRRFMLISKDGRLIRTVPQPDKLPSMSGGNRPEPGVERGLLSFDARAVLGDGSMLGRASWGRVELLQRPGGGTTRMFRDRETGYAIASARGDITKVIAHTPTLVNFIVAERNGGLTSTGMAVPFIEPLYESVAQDGSRVAFGSTTIGPDGAGKLRITVIAARGDTLLARDFPFAGTPIAKRTADSVITDRMRGYRPSRDAKAPPSVTPDVADELESKMRAAMPKASSPYRNLILGADYSMWLSYPAGTGGREYLVLDEKGNAVGVVALPKKGSSIASVTRTTVWVREYDENDLPSLVRYRIVR